MHRDFFPKPQIFVQHYHLKSALGCAIIKEQGEGTGVAHTEQKNF